ncbi:MAG: ABC transporter ATP-binding protein [Desulfurella sp.]
MILKGTNLKLSFGGLVAVNNVSFEIEEKTIFGIIGPNGAGKTTLFNIISGVYKPQEGKLFFKDKDITNFPTYKRARLGIARTHQIVKPLSELTVIENVMVGACFGKKNYNLKQAQKVALDVINFVGLSTKMFTQAGQLNVAFKKRLELARALANEPEILLLDEVLAGLNPKEVENMLNVILKIKESGVTIIMIEHLMHAIMKASDYIMVLDSGEKIAQGSPQEISNNQRVIEAYLGDPKLAMQLVGAK